MGLGPSHHIWSTDWFTRRDQEIDRPSELVSLVDWIESDGRLRTDQEVSDELFKALGFRRRGARIEDAIRKAIAQSRWRAKSAGSKAVH